MRNQYNIRVLIQYTQLCQTSNNHVTGRSVILRVLDRTQFFILNVTIILSFQRVLAGNISCGTSHVEGSQCQLSTRLTDRLRCNNPNSLALLHHAAGSQITSVTFSTNTLLCLTSQYRTNFNTLDRGVLDNIGNHLRDLISGRHDQFTRIRMINIMHGNTS